MSRFYMTLPSNSSMDYYPQNSVAHYTTKLNGQIELDGEWEVGQTEISFPFDIANVLEGECYFVLNNPGYDDSDFKITPAAGYYGRTARCAGASNNSCDIARSCAYTVFV